MTNNFVYKTIKKEFPYFILIIPAIAIFSIGILIPLALGFGYSLTNWDGVSSAKHFIGIKNYIDLFKEGRIIDAFKFTAVFTIFNTIIQNALALGIAMLLDMKIKGKNTIRTIIFAPVLLSAILCGFLWSRIFSDVFPLLNNIFNTHLNLSLFGSPDTVMWGLLIANNWQWIGYWMIIYLAALQSVPGELYEAANIDGAKPHHKFFNVTLPLIAPSITICVIGITTGSIRVFDLIMSSTNGGPGHSSESLVVLAYNISFTRQQPSLASALSMVILLVLLIIAFIQLKVLKKKEVQI